MTTAPTYLKSHPWLKFTFDLTLAPRPLWVTLGECQSKCEHISGTPLQPETAKALYQIYLAKGVMATTAIEGNTLSEEDVMKHLEGKLDLPPSRDYQKQEIDNIIVECNRILEDIRNDRTPDLSPTSIKKLNKAVLKDLAVEDGIVGGEIRTRAVRVGRYPGAPVEDCDYLLKTLCEWINSDTFKPMQGLEIVYAILRAIIAHIYLAWIHPFGDGNGRTARLVELQILISSGVPAPACQLLSNHYNQTRTEYYRQLDRASQSGGDIIPFISYAVQGLLEGLRGQLDMIRNKQLDLAWFSYIHDQFKGKDSESEDRKRQLVVDLSQRNEPILWDKVPEISPRVAVLYSKLTPRTLLRDLEALAEMNLIRFEKEGIVTNKKLLSAFLPERAKTTSPNKQNP